MPSKNLLQKEVRDLGLKAMRDLFGDPSKNFQKEKKVSKSGFDNTDSVKSGQRFIHVIFG
jgi:hypothetical protein